jgi:aminopeptidase-like protein
MIEENYIIDKKGRKIAVQVPIKTYERLVADSEELEEIKEYRKAKAHKGDAIPFDLAFSEIEKAMR